MSSNLSTESPTSTSGNVGTGGTLKDLKTDFANLLINRVTLGECLNVIRDACVARAGDLVDEADEATLENIKKDVAAFGSAGSAGEAGESPPVNVGDGSPSPVSPETSGEAGTSGDIGASVDESAESTRERIERRAAERAAEGDASTSEAPTGHFAGNA